MTKVWPFSPFNPSHKDHYFKIPTWPPLSEDPAAIFKESSFFPLFCQPAAKDDGDDDENDDLAYLNQPADDLGQLDDDDGDGDGDEDDQGGGEEEEDQLEEDGVEQRVDAEAKVV